MDKRFWAAAGRVGNKATASAKHFYIVRGARVTNGSIAPAFLFLSRRWVILTLVTLTFITALGDFIHSLHDLSSRHWLIFYTRYIIFQDEPP